MTLPDERYRAVLAAERLLKDLLSSKATPRVPKAVRQRASWVLRHFPSEYDMKVAAAACPDRFDTDMNDVERYLYRGLGGSAEDRNNG